MAFEAREAIDHRTTLRHMPAPAAPRADSIRTARTPGATLGGQVDGDERQPLVAFHRTDCSLRRYSKGESPVAARNERVKALWSW